MAWTRDEMAERAARELPAGSIVTLGIGLPTRIAERVPRDAGIWLHTENGLLGVGPYARAPGELDSQVINAGKEPVTIVKGGSIFDSALSFAMIRGGHVDVAVLGAMQVAESGDLANWAIPGERVMGIGGAMDLAAGARRVIALTTHRTRRGEPKLVTRCTYPLTARACVARVITDLGVLDVTDRGFSLVELARGVSLEAIVAATGASLDVGDAPSLDPGRDDA